MRRLLPLLPCLLAVLGAHPAVGSTAAIGAPDAQGYDLTYDAAPGEVNEVYLSRGYPESGIQIADRGAAISAGAGCSHPAGDPRVVLCGEADPAGRHDFVRVSLGDGDDALTAFNSSGRPMMHAAVDGGAGDDRMTGRGMLSGGAGNDLLELTGEASPFYDGANGGAGDDYVSAPGASSLATLWGGGGNDTLVGTKAGGNRLCGGDGTLAGPESVIPGYSCSREGTGNDAFFGGSDGPEMLDDITGGDGADFISATGGWNVVSAGEGNDVVDTRGARVAPFNTMLGEGGDDIFLTRNGIAEGILCGAGIDAIDGDEDEGPDCEHAAGPPARPAGLALLLPAKATLGRGKHTRLRLRVGCPSTSCRGTLSFRVHASDGRPVARTRYRFSGTRVLSVAVANRHAGRVRRRGTLVVSAKDATGSASQSVVKLAPTPNRR